MAERDPVKPRVALDLVALVIRPAGTIAPHDGAEEKRGTASPNTDTSSEITFYPCLAGGR
jgi:hypothetical protein